MAFAIFTNRGSQLGVYNDKKSAQIDANKTNDRSDRTGVFCWVSEVPDGTESEDMPGKGVWFN